MLTNALKKVMQHESLNSDEMYNLMEYITTHSDKSTQIGAFLTALQMKGITAEELTGTAQFLRQKSVRPDLIPHDVVDIVGTGGDHSNSFNISTTSAFVIAGAGVPVIKHGNRASSSLCGSADVLEALGYNLDVSPEFAMKQLRDTGIAFLFAKNIHPILKEVATTRKELGIRTLFNMVGPLCNPIRTQSILLGVYAPEITELFAKVLQQLGFKHAMVVHGMEGLDEMSCCTHTRVSELQDGKIRTYEIIPELVLSYIPEQEELKGGTPEVNAQILKGVLSGEIQTGPRSAVLLNAGAAIYLHGGAKNLKEGIQKAQISIDSGAALQKLNQFIEASHDQHS